MKMHTLLISGTLATLLGLSPSLAFADRDDHRSRGKQWRTHQERFDRHPQRLRRYPQTQFRGYWYSPPRYAPRARYRRHFNNHWSWAPGAIGGLWLGSAISHNYLHDRRDDCAYDCRYVDPAPRREITGCFRIERRPDGSEVRVELPVHECQ